MAKGSLSTNAYRHPYLDSCVYIAVVKGPTSDEADRADIALRIFAAAERAEFDIIASTVVRAEVVKVRRSTPIPAGDVEKINQYLDRSCIKWVEVDGPLATDAQELQRRYTTLKPLDALHVASAIRGGADYFLTWDDIILNAGIAELTVQVPTFSGQEELDIEGATTEGTSLPARD